MKQKLILLFGLFAILAVQSCGGGGSAVAKDAKADFTLTADELKTKLGEDAAQFEGKIVEVTGKVTKTHSIADGGDVSHGAHYIELAAGEMNHVSCFFAEAHDDLKDKEVTVKGTGFKYGTGGGGLKDCVVVKP